MGKQTKEKRLSKLAQKFGSQFKRKTTKTIKFGDCELIVNLPTKAQMDMLTTAIYSPSQTEIDSEYLDMKQSILDKMGDPEQYGEALKIVEDDVLVNDLSLKTIAKTKVVQRNRIEAYLNMIGFEENGEQYKLTLEDLEAELSSADIRELLDAVEAAINPDFAKLRKN